MRNTWMHNIWSWKRLLNMHKSHFWNLSQMKIGWDRRVYWSCLIIIVLLFLLHFVSFLCTIPTLLVDNIVNILPKFNLNEFFIYSVEWTKPRKPETLLFFLMKPPPPLSKNINSPACWKHSNLFDVDLLNYYRCWNFNQKCSVHVHGVVTQPMDVVNISYCFDSLCK